MRMRRAQLLSAAFVLLVLNSGWLWAFPAPDLFYIGNVLLHIALGFVLLALLWFVRTPATEALRNRTKLTYVVLSVCGLLGAVLAWIGATGPNMSVVVAHGAAGFLGTALLAGWAWRNAPSVGRATAAALVVALAFPVTAWLRDRYIPRDGDQIVNPLNPPMSMYEEGPGQSSPFFPSSSNTNTGDYIPS
ncbi:MAG: hypothetical protein KDC27_11185, partial [Acidobacteria bacterium]|nr:hypothetical protein [Acidobacteriota bacterium]